MAAVRIIWCLLFAAVHEAVFYLTLFPLGLLLSPVSILLARPQVSQITCLRILNAPRWLWLFGNDEDGFDPEWYRKAHPTWPRFWRMLVWSAWRNPVNNLRFCEWLYAPPVLGRVQIKQIHGWLLLWQGWRCRIVSPAWRLTIGFKYQPEDALYACQDWRMFGCGFGVRFVR